MIPDRDRERYLRQIAIEGFGEDGQERLARARVLIAGAGGLGNAVAAYLAAAGVGVLRIVDRGEVELGNLNRQFLYTDGDIGRPKAPSLRDRLQPLNPGCRLEPVVTVMDGASLPGLLEGMDIAVDALDNLPTRYSLNRACLESGIPMVHGAVHGMQGQVMAILPGRSACLMCLYGERTWTGTIPVLGTSPGIAGCIQAAEVIKILTGLGAPLWGRLLLFDGRDMRFTEVEVSRSPRCPHCGDPDGRT
jgi:molybdopterin/thiamine biosynthesis adenylyltransferase